MFFQNRKPCVSVQLHVWQFPLSRNTALTLVSALWLAVVWLFLGRHEQKFTHPRKGMNNSSKKWFPWSSVWWTNELIGNSYLSVSEVYSQKHRWLKDSYITKRPILAWVMTHESCMPAWLARSLSGGTVSSRHLLQFQSCYSLFSLREEPCQSCKFQVGPETCELLSGSFKFYYFLTLKEPSSRTECFDSNESAV